MKFITVDMDYFNEGTLNQERALYFLELLTAQFPIENISWVMNHQQVLHWANKLSYDHLINIDFHTDLTEKKLKVNDRPKLCCGSWAAWIKNKNKKKFTWVAPPKTPKYTWVSSSKKYILEENQIIRMRNRVREDGNCNGNNEIFPRKTSKVSLSDTGWGSLNHKIGFTWKWFKNLLKDCVHVNVCLSPGYTHKSIQQVLRCFLAEKGIKLMKGKLEE